MLLLAAVPIAAHAPTLRSEDLRKIVSLSEPQVSPDGKRVAVLVRRGDYAKNHWTYDIALIDIATRRSRTLVHDRRSISNLLWSPDGTRLAFIAPESAEEDAKAQIFVLPMDGGEPVQATHVKEDVRAFDWRPDGAAIAYVAVLPRSNVRAIKAHEDSFNVTDDAWTAQAPPERTALYEVHPDGRASRRVAPIDVDGGITYARDGRSIFATVITGHAHPNRWLARTIVRVDAANGKVHGLALPSRGQEDPLRALDGRIAFGLANPRGAMQRELALADRDGMHGRIVTYGLDRNVTGAAFAPNGDLVAVANDAAQRALFTIARSGAVHRLNLGALSVGGDASVSRTGVLAFTAAAPDRPYELFVATSLTAPPRRLTDFNGWIERYRLGRTSVVSWRTKDGLLADGVLTAPAGSRPGTRAPLVLYIHGGPTSASTIGFSGFPQVLAAHGWFVFQPNYRGSDNLGLRYARTTVPHITSVPGDDIERGLAAIMRAAPIDRAHIGVSGWSEGGLLTSWLITHDRRWAAAVSGAAVNDWTQYDAMTDSKDFAPVFIGPSPWSSAHELEFYAEESPLTYASNVRTPTLIMSDAGDYRVPTPLAYEFYHSVRATGTPVQLVIYPVVGHFPNDPVRSEDVLRRWEAWLVRYL